MLLSVTARCGYHVVGVALSQTGLAALTVEILEPCWAGALAVVRSSNSNSPMSAKITSNQSVAQWSICEIHTCWKILISLILQPDSVNSI